MPTARSGWQLSDPAFSFLRLPLQGPPGPFPMHPKESSDPLYRRRLPPSLTSGQKSGCSCLRSAFFECPRRLKQYYSGSVACPHFFLPQPLHCSCSELALPTYRGRPSCCSAQAAIHRSAAGKRRSAFPVQFLFRSSGLWLAPALPSDWSRSLPVRALNSDWILLSCSFSG